MPLVLAGDAVDVHLLVHRMIDADFTVREAAFMLALLHRLRGGPRRRGGGVD